jgi:hypothetical protein
VCFKRWVPARTVYLGGFEYGKADDLHPTLVEFGDLGVCAGVGDDVSEDVVCLEVIERNDHASAG